MKKNQYFIGWDVGAWHCDSSSKSRDAIVILNNNSYIVGTPWRGNLRKIINQSSSSPQFVSRLFSICGIEVPDKINVTLAIDTPLGFPDEFISLITLYKESGDILDFPTNPYLFRKTEQFIYKNIKRPLSAIGDQIGSQSTKGIHVLAKFAPKIIECGTWSDGVQLSVIEAYPSPCKNSSSIQNLLTAYPDFPHDDHRDALICALIAKFFVQEKNRLVTPPEDVSQREGWIWIPKDVFDQKESG